MKIDLTQAQIAESLRDLHRQWSEPGQSGDYVCLVNAGPVVGWVLETGDHPDGHGRVYVPGGGERFDARGAARELRKAAQK